MNEQSQAMQGPVEPPLSPIESTNLREQVRRALVDNMGLISYESSLDALVQLVETQSRLSRIDELNNIQLDYGHQRAQTFITGEPQNLLSRIAELKSQGASL